MTLAKLAIADDMLAYEAPFLIEKLCKEHIAEIENEARCLFMEFKKYILIVRMDPKTRWMMYSLRIDEVWHQFVLFTREYIDFCKRFFGRYIQHNPSNAPHRPLPEGENHTQLEPSTFEGFKTRYEEIFEMTLPDIWYDERSIKLQRRVHNNLFQNLDLRQADDVIELVDTHGQMVLSVDSLAADALAFMARTPSFYVRELPGQLTDDEKIGLVATLVEYALLRVAP